MRSMARIAASNRGCAISRWGMSWHSNPPMPGGIPKRRSAHSRKRLKRLDGAVQSKLVDGSRSRAPSAMALSKTAHEMRNELQAKKQKETAFLSEEESGKERKIKTGCSGARRHLGKTNKREEKRYAAVTKPHCTYVAREAGSPYIVISSGGAEAGRALRARRCCQLRRQWARPARVCTSSRLVDRPSSG